MSTRQAGSLCGAHMQRPIYPPRSSLIYSCHTPAAGAGLFLPFFPQPFSLSPNSSRSLQETEQDQRHLDRDQADTIGGLMDSSEHKVIGIGVVVPEERKPFCVECRTTATPMWRGGPTGPRSLCNACGIRYRKKRRQELGLDSKQQPKQQTQQQHQQQLEQLQPQQQQQGQQQHLQQDFSEVTSAPKDSSNSSSTKSSSLQVVKKRRVLMGVEEAAILLMALSSSSRSPTLLHG